MVFNILVSVIVLGLIGLGVLGLMAPLMLARRKKAEVLPALGQVSEPYLPSAAVSIREQMIQEKLDAVMKDYIKRQNDKFTAEAVSEYKGLLG